MLEVERAIRIPAPIEHVFSIVADYRQTIRFMPNLVRFDPIGPIQHGLGARFAWQGELHGFTAGAEFEVTRFREPRLMEAWTRRGPRSFARWELEPVAEGTLAAFALGFEIPGGAVFRVLGRATVEAQVETQVESSLRNLRALAARTGALAAAG